MTVEAACVLPLFLFFVINLLSVIEMLRFHGNLAYAMRKVGNELALYAYAYEELSADKLKIFENAAGKTVFTYLFVREELEKILGKEYLETAPVMDGKRGLVFAQAEFLENGFISFVITYRLQMPFFMSHLLSVRTFNCYYGKAWTGYEIKGQEDMKWVYAAENGEVYHLDRQCTYLRLSIRDVSRKETAHLRNDSGALYTPCERCEDNGSAFVFITNDGNRYHGSLDCSGLKRTVYTLKWQESLKYRPCSRCGKEK